MSCFILELFILIKYSKANKNKKQIEINSQKNLIFKIRINKDKGHINMWPVYFT